MDLIKFKKLCTTETINWNRLATNERRSKQIDNF